MDSIEQGCWSAIMFGRKRLAKRNFELRASILSLVANKMVPVSHWPGGCCHWWAGHAPVLLCVVVFALLGSVGECGAFHL